MKRPIALILLGVPLLCSPCQAEDPGRLFFTPQERQQLDRRGVPQRLEANVASTPDQAVSAVRLDGIVRRSDGSGTVWVNGRPAPPSAARRFADSTGAVLKLPDGRRLELKVGDTRQLATPASDPPEVSR